MSNNGKSQKTIKNVKVREDTVIGSNYCQLVSVSVTDIDVTLQFVFVNPRTRKDGQVVSRVTMPVHTAASLSEAIRNTIKSHSYKKGGKKNV